MRLEKIVKYVMICFLSANQTLNLVNKLWNQVQVSLTPIMINKIHFLSMIYLFIVLLKKLPMISVFNVLG